MGRDRAEMWLRSSPSCCRGGGPQGTERGGHVVTPGLPRCCLPGARPLIPPLLILPLICSIFPKPLIFRMQLKSCEFAAFAPVQDPGRSGAGPRRAQQERGIQALGTGRGRRDGHGGGPGFAAIPGNNPVGILEMLRATLGVSRGRAGGLGQLGHLPTCSQGLCRCEGSLEAPGPSCCPAGSWEEPQGRGVVPQLSTPGALWARTSALHLPVYPCIPLSNTSINLSIHLSVHPSLVHICLSIQPSVHPPELSIRLALPPPRRAASPGGLRVAKPTNTGPTTGGWGKCKPSQNTAQL